MDDIFDVREALKGKPESAAFNRLEERFNESEEDRIAAVTKLSAIRNGVRAIIDLAKEK